MLINEGHIAQVLAAHWCLMNGHGRLDGAPKMIADATRMDSAPRSPVFRVAMLSVTH